MAVHEKVRFKMEQAARYRVAGKKDVEIAAILGLTVQGLQRLVKLPEYDEIAEGIHQTLLGKMDATLAQQRCDPLTQQLSDSVPLAMQALIDTVTQTRDLRTRMQAAREILDREPSRRFTAARAGAQQSDSLAGGLTGGAGRLPTALLDKLQQESATSAQQLAAHAARRATPAQQGSHGSNIANVNPLVIQPASAEVN